METTTHLFSSTWGSQEWCRETVSSILNNIWGSLEGRYSERVAYDLYYGHQEQNSYNYLTRVGKYQMPARVRMINIVKPYFDILESTAASRPMPMRVYAVDENTIKERAKRRAEKIVDVYLRKIDAKAEQLSIARERIRRQREEAAQNQQDQTALMALEIQFSRIEKELSRDEILIGEELQEMERKRQLSEQTIRESKINDALTYLNNKYKYKDIFSEGFKDQLIVDNQIYRINDVYMGDDPSFRRCSPSNIWYQADPDSTYLDQANWIAERRYLSPEAIIAEYGGRLTSEQRSEIIKRFPRRQSVAVEIARGLFDGSGGSTTGCADDVYSGTMTISSDAVEVFEVEWKTVRKVLARRSKDKKDESITHTHLISDERDFKAGDERIVRYVTEYWRATAIGRDILFDMRPCAFQHRDIRDISRANSSYVGYAYNGYDNRPYSRVLAVRDVVILFQLVWYQIELLQAISGMKGVIMDITQKPANMSNDEWLSMAKRGLLPINPAQVEEESGRPTRFNAFATFDMTFGNSIAQLQNLLPELQNLAGRIIGIPPQRLGEVGTRETHSSAKMAVVQSNITTETLMLKSDRIQERVLQRIVNIIPYAWKKGKRGTYILGQDGQRMFNISEDELDGMAFELFYGDGNKEQKAMEQLMGLAMQAYSAQGSITLSQLSSLMNMNTLSELQESLEYFEGVARKNISEQGRAAEEAKAQAAERLIQLEASVKSKATEVDYMKNAIQQAQLQLRQAEIEAGNQLAMGIQERKAQTAEKIANQDTNVELQYLANDKERWQAEAKLKQIELALDGLANTRDGLSSAPDKNKIRK